MVDLPIESIFWGQNSKPPKITAVLELTLWHKPSQRSTNLNTASSDNAISTMTKCPAMWNISKRQNGGYVQIP
jgi:hypothetical protein